MTKVRKKIGTIPINDIEQQVQQSTSAAITQMQQDVSDFIDEETAQYPEIGGTFKYIEDPEGRSEVKTDAEDKILSYRDSEGVMHENVGIESAMVNTNSLKLTNEGMTEFQQALKDAGFYPGGAGDWSDAKFIEISTPRCALVNIISPDGNAIWPTSKASEPDYNPGVNADLKYYLEFWDMQGNYFKKEILFSAQGRSTLKYPKKNGAIDLCNNNGWDDEDTFSIKFGDWVSQDSFHLKAYYIDYIKGSEQVGYRLIDQIWKDRGVFEDRPWKKALVGNSSNIPSAVPMNLTKDGTKDVSLQIDNGARCMPEGFPAMVYLNGEFYGIYSWGIKKHRDNYHMDKANPLHIHLDGTMFAENFWDGVIDWSQFEVRNPKSLVYSSVHFNRSLSDWNSGRTYAEGEKVKSGSYVYKSKKSGNLNNHVSDTNWWSIDGCGFKYDSDIAETEIAGNQDGSSSYDTWEAGSYPIGKIVECEGHLFLNAIADNTSKPVYHSKNNSDTSPDFKNKTGCGWLNVTNTVKVKEAIIDLSKRVGEINSLNATSPEGAKELFDSYFDADNIIDYNLFLILTGNEDSVGNNVQWVTYDGIKWYACPYDLDMCFGQYVGHATMEVRNGGFMDTSGGRYPLSLCVRYYSQEHKVRWNELKEKGIITPEHISNIMLEWSSRIGQENFKKEWSKWEEAPCNRDSKIDFKNWVFTGNRFYRITSDPQNAWNDQTEYNVGDTAYFNTYDDGWWLEFRAVKQNVNKPCLTGTYNSYPKSMGYRDSIWRYFKYIQETFAIQNDFIQTL